MAGEIDVQLLTEIFQYMRHSHAPMRACAPPLPHFLYVLPVTNSTDQSAFREVAYVYSWSVICPLLWSKNVHDRVKNSAARLYLDPTFSSPQPHIQFIQPSVRRSELFVPSAPKFLTLHVFHMIWVGVSLIFKTKNQNSDIYNGNMCVFLCMRITFSDIIQMTIFTEMLKIQFCIVLLSTQVSKYSSLTLACPCVIINSHISRIYYPLCFATVMV